MLELAVLADDLTGGMIVASLLERAGVVCPLLTHTDGVVRCEGDPSALVLARKIRLVPPDEARAEAAAAAAAFIRRGARTVYFKYSALFDSTDRGNIGPIADTLRAQLQAPRTVFCPAYIERGVTVYQGHLFAGRTLLSDSFKQYDPVTPASTADLVAKLNPQTRSIVGLIDHQALNGDLEALRRRIGADTTRTSWVVDAVSDEDVARIATLTRDWRLVTGADSLIVDVFAARCAGRAPDVGSGRRLLPPAPGYEAVLAGSCADATREQIASFEGDRPVWHIDLARDAQQGDLVDRVLAWAAEHLKSGPVGVSTNASPARVRAAQDLFGIAGASERADTLLATLAVRLEAIGVRKFVVAGGETSGAVLSALHIDRLEVAAYDEDLFGGYCHRGGERATSFVLKPGSMGDPHFFTRALDRLREADQGPTTRDNIHE